MAKIAIVTGATGGLGQEFIKEIQKNDEIDEIWAVGRNEKKLEELRKKYSIIRPVIADFSTDGVEVIKQKIQKELRADIDDVRFLINNAGIGYMGHFDKLALKRNMYAVIISGRQVNGSEQAILERLGTFTVATEQLVQRLAFQVRAVRVHQHPDQPDVHQHGEGET